MLPTGRWLDVSMWMDDFTFAEDQRFELQGPFNRVTGSNPEYVYDFRACTQTGTHIQGPHYFRSDGRRIEEFPLSAFAGWARVADLYKRGTDTMRADLAGQIDGVDLRGRILILRTGHMDEVIRSGGTLDPGRRPGLAPDAARYLVEAKGVRMVAIDSVGLESRGTRNYEVNRYLCDQEVLILEGLVNLGAITAREVFLIAFPLKMRGVEGTPCRAVIIEADPG